MYTIDIAQHDATGMMVCEVSSIRRNQFNTYVWNVLFFILFLSLSEWVFCFYLFLSFAKIFRINLHCFFSFCVFNFTAQRNQNLITNKIENFSFAWNHFWEDLAWCKYKQLMKNKNKPKKKKITSSFLHAIIL